MVIAVDVHLGDVVLDHLDGGVLEVGKLLTRAGEARPNPDGLLRPDGGGQALTHPGEQPALSARRRAPTAS
jgi:hypothetical protein